MSDNKILTADDVCDLIDNFPNVLPEVAQVMKAAVKKGECPHALRVSLRLRPITCFIQEASHETRID